MSPLDALAGRLTGRTLSLRPPKPDWTFATDDGDAKITVGFWRLCGPAGVLLTSADHGEQFGLPAPIDGVAEFAKHVGAAVVTGVASVPSIGDLRIELNGGMTVELLCLSSGNECWEAHAGPVALVGRGDGIIDIGPIA